MPRFSACLAGLLCLALATGPLQAQPGQTPAPTQTPTPAPAQTAAEERAAWFERLKWPAAYEEQFQASGLPEKRFSGLQFFALSAGWHLVEVQVDAGAYQPVLIYMLYHKDKGLSRLLQLPMVHQGKHYVQQEVVGLAEFDGQHQELSVYSKDRGAGGCGSYAVWGFNGTEARLISLREQSCPEADQAAEMIVDPRRFPLIWPRPCD
ncbi:MAG: DUF1176 domain-containing protein [Candidatus Sericytochromatia bacterium]|nr:DUF1176 domain-containing protein [Candidatus Sericytochromatia bacterium]